MKIVQLLTSFLFTALFLSLTSPICSATTCVALPPLKPIHRISGVVLFPTHERVAKAKVTVLQEGKEIASQETGDDGKFSFDNLQPGKYEIQVQVAAIRTAAAVVVLVHPKVKPKQELAVNMNLQGCSSFSLVNPKKLEAELGPPTSPQH